MSIDEAIQRADSYLAQGNLRRAYNHYFSAIRLIADYMQQNTHFESVKRDETGGPRSRIRNQVRQRPEDWDRLFGLAHLCFTEAEDIVNGEVNFDDLESDDESDDSDTDAASAISDANAVVVGGRGSETGESTTASASASASVSASASASASVSRRNTAPPIVVIQPPPSQQQQQQQHPGSADDTPPGSPASLFTSADPSDFRQQRLTRPRSLCSSIRSSMRLSVMALNASRNMNPSLASVDTDSIAPLPSVTSTTGPTAPVGLPPPGSQPPTRDSSPVATPLPQPPPSVPETKKLPEESKPADPEPPKPLLLLPASYVPLIPSSPLQQQHMHMVQSFNRCSQELERLNTGTTTSNSTALQTLSVVRRLMETSTLLKNKLTTVSVEITQTNAKSLVDFTPRQLAVNITLCDWEMFSSLISVQDLLQYASDNPPLHPPRSFKSCMDFSIFLSRLVSNTILNSASSAEQSTPTTTQTKSASSLALISLNMSHWIQTLPHLQSLKNFQGLQAVSLGLTHPSVSRLLPLLKLPPHQLTALHSTLSLLNPANNFLAYNNFINSRGVNPPLVPITGVFLDALKRISTESTTIENRMVAFATLQGTFEQWRAGGSSNSSTGGTGSIHTTSISDTASISTSYTTISNTSTITPTTTAYGFEKQERDVHVLHWILSRMWVAEETLWDLSFKILDASTAASDPQQQIVLVPPPPPTSYSPQPYQQTTPTPSIADNTSSIYSHSLKKSSSSLNFLASLKQKFPSNKTPKPAPSTTTSTTTGGATNTSPSHSQTTSTDQTASTASYTSSSVSSSSSSLYNPSGGSGNGSGGGGMIDLSLLATQRNPNDHVYIDLFVAEAQQQAVATRDVAEKQTGVQSSSSHVPGPVFGGVGDLGGARAGGSVTTTFPPVGATRRMSNDRDSTTSAADKLNLDSLKQRLDMLKKK